MQQKLNLLLLLFNLFLTVVIILTAILGSFSIGSIIGIGISIGISLVLVLVW